MSEQNKIDEIKEALAAATPGPWEVFDTGELHNEYIKGVKNASGIVADLILTEDAHLIAKAPEYITYLLQEIERKDEALKWYGDFGNWYVKDGSWPALEDKGNRARLAYKGEGDASG